MVMINPRKWPSEAKKALGVGVTRLNTHLIRTKKSQGFSLIFLGRAWLDSARFGDKFGIGLENQIGERAQERATSSESQQSAR